MQGFVIIRSVDHLGLLESSGLHKRKRLLLKENEELPTSSYPHRQHYMERYAIIWTLFYCSVFCQG
jgi:hypothetical protein